jgi:hypothetical protein
MRWPIPEAFWVDARVDKFTPRDVRPVLTLLRPSAGLGEADYYLSLAKRLRISIDTYEIAPAVGALLSVKKALGINSNEKCHVWVEGSGDSVLDPSTLSAAAYQMVTNANLNANAINGSTAG